MDRQLKAEAAYRALTEARVFATAVTTAADEAVAAARVSANVVNAWNEADAAKAADAVVKAAVKAAVKAGDALVAAVGAVAAAVAAASREDPDAD